jgi:hypothetical protein
MQTFMNCITSLYFLNESSDRFLFCSQLNIDLHARIVNYQMAKQINLKIDLLV